MDFSTSALIAFLGVILIDLVLSGDNAIIVGTLAAGLPPTQRKKAILGGMVIALVARVILSLFAVYLLLIPGVQFLGGLLLVGVIVKMVKDLLDDGKLNDSTEKKHPKSFASAMIAITAADISMSLDNVLAVAGTAKDHTAILVFGLVLSLAVMAFAATLVANIVHKYKWIAWVGVAFIAVISGKMMYEGLPELIAWFNS